MLSHTNLNALVILMITTIIIYTKITTTTNLNHNLGELMEGQTNLKLSSPPSLTPTFRWYNAKTNKPKTVIVNPAVIVGWRTAKSSPDYVCKCFLRGKDADLAISYIFRFIESTTVFLLAWSICIYDIDLLHLWYISSLFVTKIFTTYFMKWIMFVNASWVKRVCFFISCIFNEMDYVVNASCVICKCFLKKKNTHC